jgi:hypothetical protein
MQFTKEGRIAELSELRFYLASLRVSRDSRFPVIPTTLYSLYTSLIYLLSYYLLLTTSQLERLLLYLLL